MSGASIRFSKMKTSWSGPDAWRDSIKGGRAMGRNGRPRTTGTEMPGLHTIHRGTVVSIQPFGCFLQLGNGDVYKDGLLHISNISASNSRPERVEDLLQEGQQVWVKVTDVKAEDLKYGLDMRFVDQSNGTDLDPHHSGKVPRSGFDAARQRSEATRREFGQDFGREPEKSSEPHHEKPRPDCSDEAQSESSSESSSDEPELEVARLKRKKLQNKLKKAIKRLNSVREKAEKAGCIAPESQKRRRHSPSPKASSSSSEAS